MVFTFLHWKSWPLYVSMLGDYVKDM